MLAKSRIFFQLLLSQVSNQGVAPCLEEAWSWRYLKLNGEKKKQQHKESFRLSSDFWLNGSEISTYLE